MGPRPLDQALDPQSPIGRALAEWRRDLTADLGGSTSITTAQAGMVELAVRTKLILDTVDGFILTMESPVNRRRRSVYPVVLQRQTLANGLARFLEALGLERRRPRRSRWRSTWPGRRRRRLQSRTGATMARLAALTPDDLRAWLARQRELLAPRVNGTRPAGDRLAILLACLRARGCTRCAEPLVEQVAWKAGQAWCPACALAAGGATVWVGWDGDEAPALRRSLGRDLGIPDDDDEEED